MHLEVTVIVRRIGMMGNQFHWASGTGTEREVQPDSGEKTTNEQPHIQCCAKLVVGV